MVAVRKLSKNTIFDIILNLMKKFFAFTLLLTISVSFAQKSPGKGYLSNLKLLADKDFFTAREYFGKHSDDFSAQEKLILGAYIDNAFNKPQESNAKINKALEQYSPYFSDSLVIDFLRLQQENYGRLYEYKAAAKATGKIITDYTGKMKPEEIADYKNMQVIWSTLAGQPKQEVVINDATAIKMSRDKANLANLPVVSGTATVDFIFDTGANLSTITQGTAKKLGLRILEGEPIEVGAITGAKVMAHLAVCPEFSIGNIAVRNAVFIVFPDDALAFPQIDYQINGIIGFPVIEALAEVQITQADMFIVPLRQTHYSNQNMALDFLTPVINVNGEHFTFDTGATSTSLYKKYYDKHKKEIDGKYELTELNLGGAGGIETMKGYNASFIAIIDEKEIKLEPVDILIENIGEKEHKFYGNIGQDLIKQFPKMTINFEKMFIKFD